MQYMANVCLTCADIKFLLIFFSFSPMMQHWNKNSISRLSCWSSSWTSFACLAMMLRPAPIWSRMVEFFPFITAVTGLNRLMQERKQNNTFWRILQTARVTKLQARRAYLWGTLCSLVRPCCKYFTVDYSWETLTICSASLQIRLWW